MRRALLLACVPVALVVLTATLRPTGADLVDAASTASTFDALPTLWWATGRDDVGQHGDGAPGAGTVAPVRVSWRPGVAIPRGVPVQRVSVGDGAACGIAGGRAYCWGANDHGQLGDGTFDDAASPVPVATSPSGGSALPADAVVTDIDVGAGAACAVADGNVYCWGDNSSGRLGNDSVDGSPVPVAVAVDGAGGSSLPAGTATRVATGGGGPGSTTAFTCALADGRAHCWGSRENGRLGNGVISPTPRLTPTAVNISVWGAGAVVSDISIGHEAACAIADGLAYCWGRSIFGQLGDSDNDPTTNQTIPLPVETSPASDLPSSPLVSHVAVGATSACAVHDGDLYCWGTNVAGQLGADLATGTEPGTTLVRRATAVARAGAGASELPVDAGVVALTAGGRLGDSSAWCALAAPPGGERRAYCWGHGAHGQLGLGDTGDARVPRAVLVHPSSQLPAGTELDWVAAGSGVTLMGVGP